MISKLKIKNIYRLLAFLLVLVVFAFGFLRLTAHPAEAAWFDDSYGYRVKFTFTHDTDISSERAITYTLDTLELTTANIMQGDCDDIRFTDGNGKILRFQMTGSCGSATNTFEVVFPSIVNGTNIGYAYYSNPTATSASVNVSDVTALTPSGGDPATQSNPTANDEVGPGPVSYWNFDEGQGNTNDSTLQANTLTVTNAAWKTEDQCVSDKCLYFDGNADRASKSYSSDTELLPGTDSFTVSAWLKHASTAGADTAISRVDAVNGIGWKVYMNSSGFLCFGIDAVAGSFPNDDTCTTSSFADSQWHFITAVKNGTTNIQIYVDSLLRDTQTGITSSTLNGTSSPFTVGNDFDNGTDGWIGFIDEVKYYNFARTAAQVRSDYQSRGTTKGVSAQMGDPEQQNYLSNGLVGHWKMDETSGTAADSSGNGLTLTNNGTTTFTGARFANGSSHNGTTQYFSTATAINSIQTVAFWVNPASTSDDYINLTASIYINSSSGAVSATGFTAPSIYVNGAPNNNLTSSAWNHVVVTTTTGINANAFEVARANSAYLNNTGLMDEVRLYNRTLSPAEVSALYNWAPSPIGHWKLDENTGVQAFDTSGNNNTGTLTQGPLWSSGKIGSAVSFDGINDYITVTDNSTINFGSGALTISGWFKTSSSSNEYILEKDINACTNASWLVGVTTAGGCAAGKLDALIGTTSTSCAQEDMCSATTVNDGIWHHFALVRNPSATNYLYIDGKLDAQKTDQGGSTTNTQPITIGAANNDSGSYSSFFNGLIDEIRLYNYARTPKQIIEDMNAGHPTVGTPIGSYVAYWSLDDASDTTAQDQSANNNDLTLSAASWTVQGKLDSAWNGTGTSRLARPANDSDFDFSATEDLSLSTWFRSDAPGNPAAIEYLAANGGPSGAAGYALYANTDGTLCFGIDDDASWGPDVPSCTATDYYDAAWHHIVGVRDVTADKVNLYIDGILKSSATDTTSATLDSDGTFRLGDIDTDDAASGEELAGDLDEAKVYRLALNSSDVQLEYNRGSSIVLGSLSTQSDGLTASNSAAAAFCIPGDSSTCSPPINWWKLDENTGTTAVDSAIGENDLVLTKGPQWVPGKLGSAIKYDGSTQCALDTTYNGAPVTDVTITAWVYARAPAADDDAIINVSGTDETEAENINFYFYINDTNNVLRLEWEHGDGVNDVISSTVAPSITSGQWVHFAATRNTATNEVKFYENGRQLGSTVSYTNDPTGGTSDQRVDIGAETSTCSSPSDQGFNGTLDDVRIYNYARTPAQIAWDYNRGSPVAYYAFDECQGTTAYDTAPKADIRTSGTNGTINPTSLGNTTVGTCNSGVTTEMWDDGSTGKYSSALGFDGSDDNVTISSVFGLGTTNVTIATWVYLFTTSENGAFVKLGDESPSNNGYGIGVGASTFDNLGNNLIMVYEGARWIDTNRNIGTGWHHVALVVGSDNALPQGFIDGLSVGRFNGSGVNLPTDSTKIGGYTGSGAQNRFGNYLLDDVRIYNYPLNASQMKTLYNEGAAIRFGPQTGSP